MPSSAICICGRPLLSSSATVARVPQRELMARLRHQNTFPARPERQRCPSNRGTINIALLVYTSGTTGVPKGPTPTHEGMCEAARLCAARYAHEEVLTLLNLPTNHEGMTTTLALADDIGSAAGQRVNERVDDAHTRDGLPATRPDVD